MSRYLALAIFVVGVFASYYLWPGSVPDYLRGVCVGIVIGLFALKVIRKGSRSAWLSGWGEGLLRHRILPRKFGGASMTITERRLRCISQEKGALVW